MVKGDVLAASYGRRRSDSGWVFIILLLCAFWSVTSKKGDGSGKILEGKSNMQKKTPKFYSCRWFLAWKYICRMRFDTVNTEFT